VSAAAVSSRSIVRLPAAGAACAPTDCGPPSSVKTKAKAASSAGEANKTLEDKSWEKTQTTDQFLSIAAVTIYLVFEFEP
jgi:hypothetical protein